MNNNDNNIIKIKPQPKQYEFLKNDSDICIYGGAAGGGKSYAMLLDPFHFINNKYGSYTIFRRNSTNIDGEGGLWKTALELYSPFGIKTIGKPSFRITFPSGFSVRFAHLQYDETVLKYQGLQLPVIGYDELTHFTKHQFLYMLSRNRSPKNTGIKPYIRATTNPEPDSWVRELLDWYINPETGYVIPERSGIKRYFLVEDDEFCWGDTREELIEKYNLKSKSDKLRVFSFTFIASSLSDNKALTDSDPQYESKLKLLGNVYGERLLKGNWNIKSSGGNIFKESYFKILNHIDLKDIVSICRAWDLAASEKTDENNNPDSTSSCLMARLKSGDFCILDVTNDSLSPRNVRKKITDMAKLDALNYKDINYKIFLPQDPGQAGKSQADSYIRMLSGYVVETDTVRGSKVTRVEPFTIQCEHGNVYMLKAQWNKSYVKQMVCFPYGVHDDMVDSTGDAFKMLSNSGNHNYLLDVLSQM